MSSKRYDTTINCGPNNPFTLVKRGPIKVRVLYDEAGNPDADLFVELRLGRRRQRTAITRHFEHDLLVKDLLEMLGFEPEIQLGTINYDDDYSDTNED